MAAPCFVLVESNKNGAWFYKVLTKFFRRIIKKFIKKWGTGSKCGKTGSIYKFSYNLDGLTRLDIYCRIKSSRGYIFPGYITFLEPVGEHM